MEGALMDIGTWHALARSNPKHEDLIVQLGCHFEELVEMMDCFEPLADDGHQDWVLLKRRALLTAQALKSGVMDLNVIDREGLLDALADQIVTSVGVGHCADMDVPNAVWRVNRSNWTKFDELGKPIFDANGKITKGPGYEPPKLDGLF